MLKFNGVLSFLAIWFAYHFFLTIPGEFREAELLLRNKCLTAGGQAVECNCLGASFMNFANADRLEWALRRGTFVTYKTFADDRVPLYTRNAANECGFGA